MSSSEQKYLTHKERELMKEVIAHRLRKGKLLVFTAFTLPLLVIASLIITKLFLLNDGILEQIDPSKGLLYGVLSFVLNNQLFLIISSGIYCAFTLFRGYREIKESKRGLLFLELDQEARIAELSGKPFDPIGDLKRELEENCQKYSGRTLPFLFTGKGLDFIFNMLSIGVLLSIFGESFYLSLDKSVWIWVLFIVVCILILVLVALIIFWVYTAAKGLPVEQSKDKTQRFPPCPIKAIRFNYDPSDILS